MRITSFLLTIALMAPLVRAQASTQPATTNPAAAPRVLDNDEGKQLIQRIVETHGGADAFAKVKSVRVTIEAVSTKQSGEQSRKTNTVTTIQFPDHLRQEATTVAGGASAKPSSSITVITPAGAWAVAAGTAPSVGVQELAPNAVAQYQRSIALNALNVLRNATSDAYHFAAGTEMEKVGDVDGTPLDITGPNNMRFRWLVDAKTGEILARVENNVGSTYLKWETVEGVRVPTHSRGTNTARGEATEVTTKYEINPTIDAHAFEKPPEPKPVSTQPSTQPAK